MRLLSRLLFPILLLLFTGTAAFAQEASWTISEAKGQVTVIDARGERKGDAGIAVAPGMTVRTAARSTAVLVRGREFVTLRQNAQIRIPEASRERSIIQIVQDYGSALFNIGKQADPHFGVETPYLAAVVKGTTFIINVGAEGASLQVTEGAVEVATPDGGARDLILPGAVALVAAGDTMRLVIEGEGRKIVDSPARPASAPAEVPATPAAPVSSASVLPAGGQARAEPAAISGNSANRIDEVIASSPGDVGRYSGGFVSGEVSVIAALVVSENTNRGAAPAFGSDGGRGNDGAGPANPAGADAGSGSGNGNGGGNGNNGIGNGNANNGNGNGNGNGNNGNNGNNGIGNGNGGDNGRGEVGTGRPDQEVLDDPRARGRHGRP